MQRRRFLKGAAALLGAFPLHALTAEPVADSGAGLLGAGAAPGPQPGARAHLGNASHELFPIIASPDRIIEMNVCTRPFRLQGPRLRVRWSRITRT